MRKKTHFSTSDEIHAFLMQLIQQLLVTQDPHVIGTTETDALESAETQQFPSHVIEQLATQPKIYNALYHFAEVMYEQSGDQHQKNMSIVEDCLLFKILQHGRHNLVHFTTKKSINDIIDLHDFLNPISEYPQDEPQQEKTQYIEKIQHIEKTEQIQQHGDLHQNLNQSFSVDDGQNFADQINTSPTAHLLPEEISFTDENRQQSSLLVEAQTESDNKVKKMPHFQMMNARVGQHYQARIKMQYPIVQDIYIHAENLKFSSDVGLQFDEAIQQFSGVPTQAGDFKIYFEYQVHEHESTWTSAEVTFIITADPRSLWQVNEPDADALYSKSHSDHQQIQLKNYQLLACSQRGRSHEHAGTFRDDDFFIQHVPDSDWSILIVADGAGSAPYSRQGSYLAVQHFAAHVLEDLQTQQHDLNAQLEQWQMGQTDATSQQVASKLGQHFQDVFYQAAQRVVDAIEAEALIQQCPSKAFATTLLATVVRQHNDRTFVSSFWIGDGAIAVYNKDKVRLMGKPDGGEFAGQTRFLDAQVIKQFGAQVNVGYFPACEAVILMTDGISDPRFETDAGLQNEQKWHELWQDMQPALQHAQPDVALLEWSKFFSVGHHDDRTLALLWTKAHDLIQYQDTTLDLAQEDQMVDLADPNLHPEQDK